MCVSGIDNNTHAANGHISGKAIEHNRMIAGFTGIDLHIDFDGQYTPAGLPDLAQYGFTVGIRPGF
jgi:hypothetical protein